MKSKRPIKQGIIVTFGVVYLVSFWLLTIGYATPNWLRYSTRDSSCNDFGLLKPIYNCDSLLRGDNAAEIRRILRNAFILMTTAVVVVYTNAMMLIMFILFDWLKYSICTSLLSISFGVFYPIAVILILVATIYVEAYYTNETGFSTILCTTAGCLMLFLYLGLIVYDQVYVNQSLMSKNKEKKLKDRATSGLIKEAEKVTPFNMLTKVPKGKTVEPVRN